ncbi:hypothetical protein M409DRAFT_53727 [Zasmidium cellare ATCC 36951]|uniref:Uncharacterized protein n=1 Tax=Zasmidium cellare ATCC 36951 TaxID=1080233 RepID=A0A6A6CQK9_ZASCE|nr:uncharacterized protein M409DRAFT_53727 [Zasmidium cellare ATCC 36951]KAF2167756.1 hypothetical protein M409DRAFT_53727 [Zasmidium cellare ATCC 36951]
MADEKVEVGIKATESSSITSDLEAADKPTPMTPLELIREPFVGTTPSYWATMAFFSLLCIPALTCALVLDHSIWTMPLLLYLDMWMTIAFTEMLRFFFVNKNATRMALMGVMSIVLILVSLGVTSAVVANEK